VSNLTRIQIPILATICSYLSTDKERLSFQKINKKWQEAGNQSSSCPPSLECSQGVGHFKSVETFRKLTTLTVSFGLQQEHKFSHFKKLQTLTSLTVKLPRHFLYTNPLMAHLAMYQTNNLKKLCMDCSPFERKDIYRPRVSGILDCAWPNLEILILINMESGANKYGVEHVQMKHFPKLVTLNLHNSTTAKTILSLNGECKTLTELDLSNDNSRGALPREVSPTLKMLSLSEYFTSQTIRMFMDNIKALEVLRIANYAFLPCLVVEGLHALAMTRKPKLEFEYTKRDS
jgi:hypothetical protein